MMKDVIYFELNNWFLGRDYPKDGILKDLVESHQFSDDVWCRENKLCVLRGNVDMSINWCITAPREWAEKTVQNFLETRTILMH